MTALYDRVRVLSRALYAEPKALGAIGDALYNHVRELLDCDALYAVEQELWSVLDLAGVEDEDGEIASKMIRDAIVRLADDPMRNVSDVPYGITKAEAKAAAFDDGCPFCVMERSRPPDVVAEDHAEEECACCDMMARDWRAQHADALARAGLGPRRPARAAPS